MFYLTTHSTHFIYGYMASDIWLRTILIVRKETHCRHIGYSYRVTARVLLYAPSHRQDNTYHSLCYTSRGALAGTRNNIHSNAHIFLLGLNPTEHSIFHNTITPFTCYRPLLVLASAGGSPIIPHPPICSCPRQRNRRRLAPVPMTGMHYNILALNVPVKRTDLLRM